MYGIENQIEINEKENGSIFSTVISGQSFRVQI